jgi:hypothetical protein
MQELPLIRLRDGSMHQERGAYQFFYIILQPEEGILGRHDNIRSAYISLVDPVLPLIKVKYNIRCLISAFGRHTKISLQEGPRH